MLERRAACTAVEVPKPEEARGRSKVWIIGGTNERGRKPRKPSRSKQISHGLCHGGGHNLRDRVIVDTVNQYIHVISCS